MAPRPGAGFVQLFGSIDDVFEQGGGNTASGVAGMNIHNAQRDMGRADMQKTGADN